MDRLFLKAWYPLEIVLSWVRAKKLGNILIYDFVSFQMDIEKAALLHEPSAESMYDQPNVIHDKHATFISQVEEEFM
jgi:hypothetical protein